MNAEAQLWKATLDDFRYRVDLREYRFRAEHEGWFEVAMITGGREETMAFEERFRRHAPCALEPWFEVIFWKLASQKQIRNGTSQRIARYLAENRTAGELWQRCGEYLQCGSDSDARTRFEAFLKLFGLATDSIAVVATFPAFMDPNRFPMVDTRIARWVGAVSETHNRADPSGVMLVRPRFLDSTSTVLKMNDFDFMRTWVRWCRHTADKLTRSERGHHWRARDVEMAVFRAWGSKEAKTHPEIDLPPLSPR